jgi:hypothetical protein
MKAVKELVCSLHYMCTVLIPDNIFLVVQRPHTVISSASLYLPQVLLSAFPRLGTSNIQATLR